MGEHDEDMTYTTEPTRAQLAARVAELERECAELRARLDAVPVEAMKILLWGDSASPWYGDMVGDVGNWLIRQEAQPAPAPDDDTNAPLKLATVEDGTDRRYTWQVFGLEGHKDVFGNGFLYTSLAAPVEADEYKSMRERAESAEAALIDERRKVEVANKQANQYLQLTGTQATEIKYLRTQLAAVPVKILCEDYHKRFGTRELRWWPEWALPIGRWLFPETQDDDTDAPLKLATVGDGDE